MAPGHYMELEWFIQGSGNNGLEVKLQLRMDGGYQGDAFFRRIWLPDELADIYEREHHKLHGADPRGLDPRDGPTRIHPGLQR